MHIKTTNTYTYITQKFPNIFNSSKQIAYKIYTHSLSSQQPPPPYFFKIQTHWERMSTERYTSSSLNCASATMYLYKSITRRFPSQKANNKSSSLILKSENQPTLFSISPVWKGWQIASSVQMDDSLSHPWLQEVFKIHYKNIYMTNIYT